MKNIRLLAQDICSINLKIANEKFKLSKINTNKTTLKELTVDELSFIILDSDFQSLSLPQLLKEENVVFTKNNINIEALNTSIQNLIFQKKELEILLQDNIQHIVKSSIFDYCINIGKPNNKNEKNYKKEELSDLITKIYQLLLSNNIPAFLVDNKILLVNKKLSSKIAINYIYALVSDLSIVKNQMGGLAFKGVIQIDTIESLNINQLDQVEEIFSIKR